MSKKGPPLVVDPATSKRLSKQPRRDTTPEKVVCRFVRGLGHRYRKNSSNLPGSPDLSNKSKGWAVFVHGCYWHHHEGCKKATIPTRNRPFWVEKFRKNRERDVRKVEALEDLGFRVLTVWECETKEPDTLTLRLESFLNPS